MRINRKTLLILGVVAILIVGVGGLVLAAQSNGLILNQNDDDNGSEIGENEGSATAADATLTQDEAIAIAEAERNSTATAIELEREHGKVIYSIELADGSEVEVDANTGDILQIEGAGSDSD